MNLPETFHTRDTRIPEIQEKLENLENKLLEMDLPEAVRTLQYLQELSHEAQNVQKTDSLQNWLKIYTTAEFLSLKLLDIFRNDLLPEHMEVTQWWNNRTDKRNLLFEELKQQYPFAFRSTESSHLYLVLLKQIEAAYGKFSFPPEESWAHEVKHFANRLAIDKPFLPTGKQEFHLIVYRIGENLGYKPFLNLDTSNLTAQEKIFIVGDEIEDLSEGDRRDLFELKYITPFKSLMSKIRQKLFPYSPL